MNNIYKDVKEVVSVKDAASFYGIKVNRNGMCICPFHNDRNPSMKVDKRFHCFGCQENGDVIDFVSKLFPLRPIEAAEKIAADFYVPTRNYSNKAPDDPVNNNTASQISKKSKADDDFRELVDLAIHVVCDFHRYWWKVREAELPLKEDEDYSELFCTANENLIKATEWLRILENGKEDEKNELLNYLCNK